MRASNGDSQLKLSPVSGRGFNVDSPTTNRQSNPPSNFQSQTPTLPPSSDEKDINSTPKVKENTNLTLQPHENIRTPNLTLPTSVDESESVNSVDLKRPEYSDGKSGTFSPNTPEKNLPNLPSLQKSKSLIHFPPTDKNELSLDDNESKKASSSRENRSSQPNLKKKRHGHHETAPLFFPPAQWSSRYGIQFFTVEITRVRVVEDSEKGVKGSYALYHLEIKRGRQKIERDYRYSEFSDFHRALLCSSIAIILQQGKIYLPAKTWFRNVTPAFLEKRRRELEKYLHKLLRFKYSPRESIVQKFLALNEFVVKDFWVDH